MDFGLTERFSKKVYFQCVPKRTRAVLLKIIEERVEPESVIMSDSWRAYLGWFNKIIAYSNILYFNKILDIKTLDKKYTQKMVNHSINFVDPSDRSIHTQKIESIWRVAKRKFKSMGGVDRKYLDSYLTEFTWRYSNNNNHMEVFEKLITLIPKHFSKVFFLFSVLEISVISNFSRFMSMQMWMSFLMLLTTKKKMDT